MVQKERVRSTCFSPVTMKITTVVESGADERLKRVGAADKHSKTERKNGGEKKKIWYEQCVIRSCETLDLTSTKSGVCERPIKASLKSGPQSYCNLN